MSLAPQVSPHPLSVVASAHIARSPVATASLSPVPDSASTADAVRGQFECRLSLRHAGVQRVSLRYERLGAATLPTVLVAGGISAGRHVAAGATFDAPGWWDAQVGTGRALDPAHCSVLAIDWLGADGALDVPIDPADQADAIAALLDALGIEVLEAFVGCSYGAMVGLQFGARHDARLRHLVAISGTHRAHPYASAWRALQRRAIALGALQCDERDGVVLARQLAVLSYRTPEEFDARFGAAQVVVGRVRVAAEDYLDHVGDRHAARTTATAFVRLSESIDLQDVAPENIRVATTVVAVAEDRLLPIEDAFTLVERLRTGAPPRSPKLRVLRSRYGHDAFLKETDAIAGVLREALAATDVRGRCGAAA